MYQQLGAQDAQFIYSQTPSNLTHIMAVSVYDPATAPKGRASFPDIVEHVRSRLLVSPVFTRKLYRPPLCIDHPYWVEDEHFDLGAHITRATLPKPADWRQFALAVSSHFSNPMDMGRPLWDLHVLDGLDNVAGFAPGSYAVITRLHHSAIDGIGAAQLMAALCDFDAHGTPAIPLTASSIVKGQAPNSVDMVKRALQHAVSSPLQITRSLVKHSPELLAAARDMGEKLFDDEPSPDIPDTRFNGPVSQHKVFDALTYTLAAFKAIKSAVDGATINDAVLAVAGGALRTYLQKYGELPDNSLIGWCPINTRPEAGSAQSTANSLSGMRVPIGSDIEEPLARLRAIRRATAANKSAESGVAARMMVELIQYVPGPTMLGLARVLSNERFAPKICNLFVSNVPGSPIALYMNGAQCTHQFGLAPLANGMGLFIAAGSYNGKLVINIISDRNLLPDIEYFRECVDRSVKELIKLTANSAKQGRSKRTALRRKLPIRPKLR
jgi:diacylglycerol O-acyltransferase / wax synthase